MLSLGILVQITSLTNVKELEEGLGIILFFSLLGSSLFLLYFYSPFCSCHFLFSLKHSWAESRIKWEVGRRLVVSLGLRFLWPSKTDASSRRTLPFGRLLGELWSLWKSQRVEKRILSHVWQSLHRCWCCEWMFVRGWGECESIRGGVYAKTSEEVLEACDGAHKLSFLLL